MPPSAAFSFSLSPTDTKANVHQDTRIFDDLVPMIQAEVVVVALSVQKQVPLIMNMNMDMNLSMQKQVPHMSMK